MFNHVQPKIITYDIFVKIFVNANPMKNHNDNLQFNTASYATDNRKLLKNPIFIFFY
jgi:hypothetical protein